MFRDGPERLLVFRVGAECFGVPLALVDEVVDEPVIQRLPDTSSAQLGMAALRGELVMVYDTHVLLRVPEVRGHDVAGALLLFRHDGHRVGLAIDDVQDAMTVEADDARPLPGADASDRTLVGLVRRSSVLIAILDVGAVLDSAMAGDTGGTRT